MTSINSFGTTASFVTVSSGTCMSEAWSCDQGGSTLQFLDRSGSAEAVKLVVFDFDETLTLATFAPKPGSAPELLDTCVGLSFPSPWVEERLRKLDGMLDRLTRSDTTRHLAVLTRNSGGVRNVLLLLDRAGLGRYFSAVWCMPLSNESAYREDDEWRFFTPGPVSTERREKPDILQDVTQRTEHWLPGVGSEFRLSMENVLLVDDDEDNFQSSATGVEVVRGCKIPIYFDSLQSEQDPTKLGGLGARCSEDFAALERFVAAPWLHSEGGAA